MQALSKILIIKIVLTSLVWCIPLLFFPAAWLKGLGFPVPEPQVFLRLLGMAYVALVVGYGFGLCDARRQRHPKAVVWVGLVSNGGACLLLSIAALSKVWDGWGMIAQSIMWGSLFGTGVIAIGLAYFGLIARYKPIRPD